MYGVSVLSPDGSWSTYKQPDIGLVDDWVPPLAVDGRGRVWVGTEGGLKVLSPDGSWQSYTQANSGLGDDPVHALAVDSQGRVWAGTKNGLTVFDTRMSIPAGVIQILGMLRSISLVAFFLQVLIFGVLFLRKNIRKVKVPRESASAPLPAPEASVMDQDFESTSRTARKWYWWLWLSPLLTLPTLFAIISNDPGYNLVCPSSSLDCNYAGAAAATVLIAVLGSALWHLVLLIPALSRNRFVRWHGRQALVLAGVRTLIPLVFGLVFYGSYTIFLFIPLNFIVWLVGNLVGQRQASRGDSWLARAFGKGAELPVRSAPVQAEKSKDEDVEVF
jgi:uncharacterized membrane protein YhaH (DUF805 family)